MYAFLLQEGPATGYRIAQAIGRPVGNVYKAVEALEAKGAVLSAQDADTRVTRAVPIAELLARLERKAAASRAAAAIALADLSSDAIDDRVYQIQSRDQLLERCRRMLAAAEQFVLTSACPAPLGALADDLVATAARGVAVGVKAFEPAALPGVELVIDPRGLSALTTGPGQWLYLTVDGREFVHALLSDDGTTLQNAVWSASPLMAWTFFTGISSDFVLAALRRALAAGASAGELRELSARMQRFESPTSVGKLALIRHYRTPGRAGRSGRTKEE
ncbi:Sugar-specific transcriptional regulator TrmB [Phycisphaerae bacterium RAS1]|nr:Sugar-specific transcriptional regulator TrmB [Phycisphaerae bacterium RAS1]